MAYNDNPSYALSTKVTSFLTAGTFSWTPNANAKVVEFYVWGSGGGGGSGRCGVSTSSGGGSGGGAGGFTYIKSLTSLLTISPYVVTVASGGAGGPSLNAITTNGNPGTAGNPSSVGTLIVAPGGGAGLGGVAGATGTTTSSYVNAFFLSSGPNAGTGSTIAGNAPTSSSPYAFATGGGGGGGYSAVTAYAGGAGGKISDSNGNTLVAGGLAGSNAGGSPSANTGGNGNTQAVGLLIGGTGGGGGGCDTSNNAGSGGNGVLGGGGGGGAGTLSSTPSGAGGIGGDGKIVIIEYF